ncbi:unnamed protein product [Fusarium fujikuroi]|uniref:Uncharacterized protein n=1 Tax=Fusarium fujikuroi TaxID=5127 RepID=A0A9Q9RW50_FUSFU|nr:uncharacterized protein FFE2_04885 [Fusarium fujikuroi]SCV35365.1 uncharacterized protein FFFS_04701 [Fusarium fujikuroi]VTT63506.1 unnamed protein product [Fusarium fujikuroi]VTT73809.1 unnamed protein product [Fusarium fujikuroi]VZI04247.1 unnamed protein product [Fusarium fujikuroi]
MVKSFIFVISTPQTFQHDESLTALTANDDLDCNTGNQPEELTEDIAIEYFVPWLTRLDDSHHMSPLHVLFIYNVVCYLYNTHPVDNDTPEQQLLHAAMTIWDRHGHLPPLDIIEEISQNDAVEAPGFRVVRGKTIDTMRVEIQHNHRWMSALEAVPCLIWAVYQRLKDGDQLALNALIIHSFGEEVTFEDICQQCVEYGVLTGGCKRLPHGTCSNCVFNGRRCTL